MTGFHCCSIRVGFCSAKWWGGTSLNITKRRRATVWAWFLVVKEIEPDFDLDDSLMLVYEEHFRWLFGSPMSAQPAETLDRSNRDPAYWTFERKELLRKEREARLAALKTSDGERSK